jgi:DNA-directed RNA polymerase subunit RPC12/RpoP
VDQPEPAPGWRIYYCPDCHERWPMREDEDNNNLFCPTCGCKGTYPPKELRVDTRAAGG